MTEIKLEPTHDCCSPISQLSGSQTPLRQPSATPGICPACGHKGKAVDTATVKAMLAVSLAAMRDTPYLFCREADCPVAYFSADGTQTFTTDQLRERVFQKEPDSEDVFVCYCFRHTPGSIRDEIVEIGQSTVVDAINAGIKAEQCACDLRNPQGSCCLGNVGAVVKRVQKQALIPLTENHVKE
ncbi:MAG: putative iron-sulfur cluster-binding metallochaperone [Aggregatilineales bacterium]